MGLLATIIEKISDHPVLFIVLRGVLENNFKATRALIRAELKLGQGLRCLDLGCGPGAFADLFEGDDYLGVDRNPRYIDHAQRKRKGRFLVGDARRVALPSHGFDQVLIFGLLHHLDDDDVRAVLSECRRLLVPGGRMLIIEDIPTISRMNFLGHFLHQLDNGQYIRPVDAYRRLYAEAAHVEREKLLQSGICDYYAVVLAV